MKTPLSNSSELWRSSLPVPHSEAHKYNRGHTLVLSGGLFTTGAARLAARSALRVGSGLVTLGTPREAAAIHGAHVTAIMLRPVDTLEEWEALLEISGFGAVVIGPGRNGLPPHSAVAQAHTRSLVEVYAWKGKGALVLDADGLTSFVHHREELHAIATGMALRPVVITPHEGEFARLFPHLKESKSADILGCDKAQRALEAAKESGCWVVLKGARTCIAAPEGQLIIDDHCVPWLATAGTGDVLAGMIAGLLAQGMPVHDACSAAVWLHGEAGHKLGVGLISDDLPEVIPSLLRYLVAS
jgi:hydroxyethylthiazole kinase-like uncharacterized protein yjeF